MFNQKNIHQYILPLLLVFSNLHALSSQDQTLSRPPKEPQVIHGLFLRDAYFTVGGGAVFPIQRKTKIKHDSSSVLFRPTQIGTSLFTLPDVTWKNKYKIGYEVNGIVGCNLIPELRAEAEFIYQNFKREITGHYNWEEIDSETTVIFDSNSDDLLHPSSSQVNLYNLLTDLIYDIKTSSPLNILLGGGFGISWIGSKSTSEQNLLVINTTDPVLFETSPTLEKSPSLTGTAFAWQLKFGLNYAFYDFFSMAFNYRVLGTTRFWTSTSSITTNPNTSSAAVFSVPHETIAGCLNNSLNLSFQFRF